MHGESEKACVQGESEKACESEKPDDSTRGVNKACPSVLFIINEGAFASDTMLSRQLEMKVPYTMLRAAPPNEDNMKPVVCPEIPIFLCFTCDVCPFTE
jgi:hypothetical protein